MAASGLQRRAVGMRCADIGHGAHARRTCGLDARQRILDDDALDRLAIHAQCRMQEEIGKLTEESEDLTRKIELARELPATILQTATIPVDGLTVEDGVPLIHGLPISNLSDGELLELCVDITVSKPGQLQIILIDGAERLDKESREKLYAKCKAKGLQLIATRVTDSNVMEVTNLDDDER